MEKNFEVLQFPVERPGNRLKLDGYQIAITRTGCGKESSRPYHSILLSDNVGNIVRNKNLTHVRLHVEKYTRSIFMLFLKSDNSDAAFKANTSKHVIINNRGLVNWLAENVLHLDGDFRQVRVMLSDDLSNSDDYATFKLIF